MSNANSLIDKNNIYSQYWENVKESDLPSYANKIITIDFEEFKKEITKTEDGGEISFN